MTLHGGVVVEVRVAVGDVRVSVMSNNLEHSENAQTSAVAKSYQHQAPGK